MNVDVAAIVKQSKAPLNGKVTVEQAETPECLYSTKEMEEAQQNLDGVAKAYLRDLQRFHDVALDVASTRFQQVLYDEQPHTRDEFLTMVTADVDLENARGFALYRTVDAWMKSDHQIPPPIADLEKTVTKERAYRDLVDAVADVLLKDRKAYERTGDPDDNWQLRRRARGKREQAAKSPLAPKIKAELPPQKSAPALIPLDTPILPAMPTDALPSRLNDMVHAVAAHTETPAELAAGFGLAVVATACQQRIIVQIEPDYTEPLNIWPTTTLESGNRKTAVMMQMVAPLVEAERRLCDLTKEKILTVESERETIRAKVKALREATAKKKGFEDFEDKKQEIANLESTMPEVLSLPRLWVQDITPEKLGQVMAENGERIALISDEGGLFDTLAGRYSNGIPNLDLFLQTHAGSPVRVHRGSRPDVVMDRPALTIALSPQPSVLQGLANQPGFRGRGLLARFLYALPVSRLGYRTLTSQPIPSSVKDLYQDTITTLLKIEAAQDPSGQFIPHILTLSPKAHAEWKEFQRTVEEKMRDGGDYEHIRDWAGKLPGAAARLAGLLHCVEHTATLLSTLTISLSTMQQALALAAFYQAHALAAFDAMGADYDLHAARHVWRWVERVKKTTFTARECFQALRGTYKKMEQLNPAFPVLIERGYLIEQEPPSKPARKPGRKTKAFLVNPLALKEQS